MTQEDKILLLKDLCARLPYHCRVFYEYVDDLDNKTYGYSLTLNTWCIDELNADKAVVKPYLRPMSSMTEEEEKEYAKIVVKSQDCSFENSESATTMANDWLLSKGFDVRGLISKGLAIEVTKENNPYKE